MEFCDASRSQLPTCCWQLLRCFQHSASSGCVHQQNDVLRPDINLVSVSHMGRLLSVLLGPEACPASFAELLLRPSLELPTRRCGFPTRSVSNARRRVCCSTATTLQLRQKLLLCPLLAHAKVTSWYLSTYTMEASWNWPLCCASCNVATAAHSDPPDCRIPTGRSNSERRRAKSASRVVLIACPSSGLHLRRDAPRRMPSLQCSLLDCPNGLCVVL